MASKEPEYTMEELLAQDDWLRQFVRQLLRSKSDESLVDDVVQDVWMIVIQKPWETIKKPRSWLAAIARNKTYGLFRSSNEAKRIVSGADLGSVESDIELPEDVLVREEVRGRLIRAVHELEEPYRTVLLLRFYSGLSFWQIARRREIPVSTARIQAYRGREKLRAKLDEEEFRGGTLWAALPLIANPWVPAAPSGPEVSTAASRLPWALTGIASLALVGGAAIWWGGGRQPGGEQEIAPAKVALAGAGQPSTEATANEADDGVDGVDGVDALAQARATLGERVPAERSMLAEDWTLSGRVHLGAAHRSEMLFAGGIPVRILLYPGYDTSGDPLDDVTVDSLADGSFRFSRSAPEGAVTAVIRVEGRPGTSYVPYRPSEQIVRIPAGDPPPTDLRIAVFRRDMTLKIRVIDASGAPVRNATLAYHGELTTANEHGLAHVRVSSYDEIIELECWAEGSAVRTERIAPKGADRSEYEVQLDPGVQLEVIVTDAETGAAVEGVQVTVDRHPVLVTDEQGRCVFRHLPADEEVSIAAFHPGYARKTAQRTPSGNDPGPVEMKLVRGWSVAVEVVDGAGLAVSGAKLTLGFVDGDAGSLEGYSDDRGAFEFQAVRSGPQKLFVLRNGFAPALVTVHGPGALRVVLNEGRSLVRTRVRTETGVPLVGAKVEMLFENWVVGRTCWAGTGGEVVLENCPADGFSVWVSGPGIAPAILPFEEGVDLVVERAYSFSGTVQDAGTGALIERFLVRILAPEAGEKEATRLGAAWRAGHEFLDGEFTSLGETLGSGRLRLEVSAEGYATDVQVVDLEGSLTNVDLVIELKEAEER